MKNPLWTGPDFEGTPIAAGRARYANDDAAPVVADRLSPECVEMLMRGVAMGLKPEIAALRREIADARGPEVQQKRLHSPAVQIKKINPALRQISGWASVGTPDRTNEVVVPEGLHWELPMPLLFNHDATQICGSVVDAHRQDNGVQFTATVGKSDTPGLLHDRLQLIWEMITQGLLRSVSIAFVGRESEMLKGQRRWLRAEWVELSLVSVPAHPMARIVQVHGDV